MPNADALRSPTVRRGIAAGLGAALPSGIPSTTHSLLTGRDVLEPALAAGSVVLPWEHDRLKLLAASVGVHLSLSVGWGVVLARLLPGRRPVVEGVAAGLGIAALDLGVVGRLFPRVRALPQVPQVLDHVAYGVMVSLALRRLAAAARSGTVPRGPRATSRGASV